MLHTCIVTVIGIQYSLSLCCKKGYLMNNKLLILAIMCNMKVSNAPSDGDIDISNIAL